jgi:putative spermidine/putrescine transport system substrate-binding protein
LAWLNVAVLRLLGVAAISLLVLFGCGGGGSAGTKPPTAGMNTPSTIRAGEGQLNLVTWQGYTNSTWVDPFVQQTGCSVNARFAASPDEMAGLMASGGGGQWDMVSATADIGRQLINDGDVRPMNTGLIPDYASFLPPFKSPAFNTVDGVHYGISLQWGTNLLLYNTNTFSMAPPSWDILYDPTYSGLVTVPDNAMQIADAALLLMKKRPDLKITDPYELTQAQFDAAVALLKTQRPLVIAYWSRASEEVTLFRSDQAQIGVAWPYQAIALAAGNAPVKDTIPAEGATAWADSWMMAAKATHPNCAYLWTRYVSTPKVQAMQAISYGESPVNGKACAAMNTIQQGSCAQHHADAAASYLSAIRFWKTPLATCDDGSQKCVPFAKWQTAWTAITA